MHLIIQADATPDVGAGHVMRCASLAEAWLSEGLGTVSHRGSATIPFVSERLKRLGVPRHRDSESSDRDAVLVVDTYDESAREAASIGVSRLNTIVDDVGGAVAGYDVVWNPNGYSARQLYSGFAGVVISGKVAIRNGLPSWTAQSKGLAVSLGGGTPPAWIVDALSRWATRGLIRVTVNRAGWAPAEWTAVGVEDPWIGFSRCAMMLTTAGSTVWEAANVGIPTCVVILAPNQSLVGEWARTNGAPVFDAMGGDAASRFIAWLDECATRAVPLPRIENGAVGVARDLYELASK